MKKAFKRAALTLALFMGAGVAVALPASPAMADTTLCSGSSYSTCTNAGYTDHGYGANSGTSYWGMYAGHNCTNYAAYVLQTVNGQSPVTGLGNANMWATNATNKGFAVNNTPGKGSVAQWNASSGGAGSSGHVAYVESVNNDGSITVSEDNSSAGPFKWRVISSGSSNWPSNFIHFKDLAAPPSLPSNRFSGGGNASTREVGAIDLFVRGTNGGANMYHNFTDNGPWSGWFQVDNSGTFNITSAPAAVSWAPDRIDVFARDTNGALAHKAYAYGSWHQWETLGGCTIGAPTVTSWGPGRLDVFAQSCNITGPNLWHKFWYQNAWYEEMVPVTTMRIASAPSATAWGDGRIDLFARGENGDLLHKWFVNNAWGDWTSKGGCIIGAPAVASWAYGRLDVFARNCNTSGNNVDHTYYESGNWSSEPLPGNENLFVLDLSGAISWGPGRIDIFGRNSSGEAIHKWFASSWYNWQSLGGAVLP